VRALPLLPRSPLLELETLARPGTEDEKRKVREPSKLAASKEQARKAQAKLAESVHVASDRRARWRRGSLISSFSSYPEAGTWCIVVEN